MLQQVMTNPGEIIFREVPVPEIKDDQVLVKIMNIGICGSDIHVYHGKHPFTKYPVTQGHEVSGEIVKVGKDASGLREGQKVTIEPQVYCGHCYPCRHGKYNLCEELKDTSEKFFLYIWISVLIYGSCGKVKIALFQMLQLQIRE